MQKRTLNNGLKVICYPIEHAMSVEIGLYIRAGARYENKENNGITHLLEHMHFRQLGDMNQKEIYETTEMMGTSLRGTTYKEMLCFNMKVRPKYLEKSLDIFEKIYRRGHTVFSFRHLSDIHLMSLLITATRSPRL